MWSASCSSAIRRAAAFVGVVDAGGRSDEHERTCRSWMSERGMECHSATHRVADVRRGATGRDQPLGALPQVDVRRWRRVAVAGEVDCERLQPLQPFTHESVERAPRARRLREAVSEDDAIGRSDGVVEHQAC